MSNFINGPTLTAQAGAALAKNRLVRFNAGKLAYNGATNQDWVGVTELAATAADEYISVRHRFHQGAVCVETTAAAISTVGSILYAAANGKVASTGSVIVGQALSIVGAAGGLITMLPFASIASGGVASESLQQLDARPFPIPLFNARATGTGAILGNTAGTPAGAMGLTPGTHGSAAPVLVGEAANNNSKTNRARFLIPLPETYEDGETVTLRFSAKVGGALAVAQTIDVTAHKLDGDATVGSDLCTTAAQTLTTSFADYDFTITPTGLVAGDVLDVEVTLVANDTGGSANQAASIGLATLLCDVRS